MSEQPWHAVMWATYHAMLDAAVRLKPGPHWDIERQEHPMDAIMAVMARARDNGIDPVCLGQAARVELARYARAMERLQDT